MFIVTTVVGTMCAVLDSNDYTLEWFDKDMLFNLNNQGISIKVVTSDKIVPVNGIEVPMDKCYWGKSDKSIFSEVKRVSKQGKNLIFITSSKKYKCKIIGVDNKVVKCLFTNGLIVNIDVSYFKGDLNV